MNNKEAEGMPQNPEQIPQQAATEKEYQDLGLGSKLGNQSTRLIDKNGLINVKKTGGGIDALNIFQELLAMNWLNFFLLITVSYILINILFAMAYIAVGIEYLSIPKEVLNASGSRFVDKFAHAFYFSAQTFTTVGYGSISPIGNLAHLVATFEAMIGLMGFALVTGVLYGRFSRPSTKISYSEHAIIAPYQDINSFQFKMVNKRKNQLMEMEVQVVMMGHKIENGEMKQVFYPLDLERDKVTLFPLTWTIVHPIGKESPLYQKTQNDLKELNAEFLVLVKAFDDTFSQKVHSRQSYSYEEIAWGKKFIKNFHEDGEGAFVVELDKISDFQPAELNTY